MPIRLAQACLIPRDSYVLALLRKSFVGQRFHSGGNLQHAVESHHRPESPVESEHELVEIALQVRRADSVVCSQEPRIQVPEHNVDHWEMLVRLGLITSDWQGNPKAPTCVNRIGMLRPIQVC